MAFEIAEPAAATVDEISDVHLRAMESNELLHAQFPNPSSIEYLHGWLGRNTTEHVRDDDKGVLVALDAEHHATASFIKWLVHQGKNEDAEDVVDNEEWPESCRREYLDSYGQLTESVRKDVMRNESYYHVTFLCTDPTHGGRGAASTLLRRVQQKAEADGMAVVLESTMEAVGFYQRLGFEAVKKLGLKLPRRGSSGEATVVYEERCMVWRPSRTPDAGGVEAAFEGQPLRDRPQ
ncbi:hypothetical protein S7711_04942 [Stachybotrys chartarum IBT 7711]|uniref:N-acetyltransferase domain-containing protein n=1 Tax=Stachybotrys chartarum (strain CBS 109288 / IBT 7711) TaxID=1280523 RepID=A0A084AV31_STACB|nr:hypothetical protein S7711_04942 [Stachybotrys chartarum IBT 7711]